MVGTTDASPRQEELVTLGITNADQHGCDEDDQRRRLRAIYTAEINSWVDKRDSMLPRDHHLLPDNVPQFCEGKTVSQLKSWLQQYRPAFRASIDIATKHAISDVPTITSFFSTATSSTTRQQRTTPRNHPSSEPRRSYLQRSIQTYFRRDSSPMLSLERHVQ